MTTAEVTGGIGQPAAEPGMPAIRVRLLGRTAVTAGDRSAGPWERPAARRLVELVLVSPGRRISRDLACEELFTRLEPRAAARALSKALTMARAALAELGEPGAALLGADLTHIWAAGDARVDAADQLAALTAALAMPPGPDRDHALAAALAEEGELLADEPYAEWAARPREHLAALRQQARLALARDRAARAAGARPDDAALAAWQAAFEHDPAGEEAAGALMRGYLARGQREQAVRVYERCAAALADLGLSASPSLDELRARVTRSPASAAAPAAPAARPAETAPEAPATGPAAGLPAPREELRTVTMLFAEVAAVPAGAGSRMDPEEVRDVIGTSLAAVIAEVEALGGMVTSVSGRGLQAMWGAPRSHEDDPERTLRAAYRALAAVASPGARCAATVRIGVETGPAVVGAIGGGRYVEYGALGEVVSAAASLQSLARPGTALVGPATRAAAGHLFSWGEPEGPDAGAPGQGAAYLGAPLAAGSQLRLGARGPIVGRRAERGALDAALREAIAGHGSMVLLRGEPGLGKTRLVQECRKRFMAWVGARDGRLPLWLEGRSASYASATPYGLYQQLLAGWTGAPPDQPRPVARAALEKALTTLLASTDLLPALEHVMGLVPATRREEMGPEELRRVAFAALRTVISRLVPARRPAVIVLEDLHWADPTSLTFTRELVTLTAGRPLLILATTRPDHGPEVGELAAAAGVRTVELGPLPDAAARELARELIGGDPGGPGEDVIDAIVETVDGNPLFLEERLSVLLETGALAGGPGGWRLASAPGPALPQVLDRLVRSRIDLLTPAAQDVVRVASVLGPQFPAGVLRDVYTQELSTPNATRPHPEFTTALRELAASGILQQAPGSPGPGGAVAGDPGPGGPGPRGLEASYQFRHALIQEAAYYGMLRADRRRLHGRAAAALEASRASCLDEIAAVLGRHYAAAGMSAKAIRYLELAGDNATWSFANDEAISAYQEALAVSREAADADAGARLCAKLANVLWRTARKAETRAAFTEALRLSATLAPGGGAPGSQPRAARLRRAWLLTRLGRLEIADGRYDAAGTAFNDAEAILGDARAGSDDEAGVWLEMMLDGRASLLLITGDVAGAHATLELARPVLEARGRPSHRYSYHMKRAFERVNPAGLRADDEAVAQFRRGLAAARESRDAKDIGYATYFVGWALWLRRELDEAHQYLTEALQIAERVGEVLLRCNSLGSLVLVALARHDAGGVRALAPRAAAVAEEFEAGLRSWANAPLAWLAWQEGRPGDVIAIAELAAAAPSSPPGLNANSYRWVYLFPLTALYLDRGDTGAAVSHARRALAEDQQALPGDLAAAVREAAAAWDSGAPDDAAAALREALRLASAQGYF